MSNNNDAAIALLEKHFDIAFTAPDGIKKLRELILSLAMQGKLIAQDPSDQPANELLREIESKKNKLVKEGKIKQSKPLPEIKPNEIPYDLPKGWEWVRLLKIVAYEPNSIKRGPFGSSLKKDYFVESGYKVYQQKNAIYNDFSLGDYYIDHNKFEQLKDFEVKPQDIIVSCSGTVGKLAIAPKSIERGVINQALLKFTLNQKIIDNRFFVFLFSAYVMKTEVLNDLKGTAQKNIVSVQSLKEIPIPLPPFSEQRRIVAKIDELMARCDELEKLRGDRDRKQITVHTAALNRLLIAKEQSEFNTAWQFITQHFGELYSVKENVAELRKAILQLAVMGKLVPQDPVDVPAAILLQEIRKRVNELVYQKEEKDIKFESINAEEKGFLLPKSWLWVRLGSLLQNIKYGTSKKCAYDYPGTTVLRIPNINVEDGGINLNDLKYTHLSEAELKELYLRTFDLLIIRSNGSESLVGRSAIVRETEEGLAYAGYLVRLRSFPEYIYSPYLCHALNTVFVRKQIEQPLRTTSGVKNINSKEIANLLLPLPPFPEQRCIVAKIDQLMALCDNLEKQIDNANSKQTNLLNAVMTKI